MQAGAKLGAFVRDVLLSLVLALVVILFLYQPVKVEAPA